MTREEARKAAEVMLAYANGEEVETLSLNGKHVFIKTPSFNWGERENIELNESQHFVHLRIWKNVGRKC